MTNKTTTQLEEKMEIKLRNLSADFHSGMIDPVTYSKGIFSAIQEVHTEAIKEERARNKKELVEYLKGMACASDALVECGYRLATKDAIERVKHYFKNPNK